MDKRYQVFVSSTYEDLHTERQEVMHALLELDCIPAGMELFPAANEDQWTVIKRVIDDCDYYLVIVAGRHGSLSPEGVGYTEMEYRYAVDQQKPVIAFLHKDPESLEKRRTEQSQEGQQRLASFRDLLQQRMCKSWKTPDELGSVVSRSLVRLMKDHPATGWVRADQAAGPETIGELVRLRRRVEELEESLANAKSQPPIGSEEFAQGKDEVEITLLIDERFRVVHPIRMPCACTWDEIFGLLAPLMIHEEQDYELKRALNEHLENRFASEIRRLTKGHGIETPSSEVLDADFQTVKVQLRALGLITQSIRQRSLKEMGYTHWTLTPYGDTLMNKLRAIRRQESLASQPAS
ncbi:MAG: DUF4062 domain-containing protein [candidate division Zixibacteria bacterium]|nr:DUF4062 domain-containing protein [candidate division Zixibacteria bacterium]